MQFIIIHLFVTYIIIILSFGTVCARRDIYNNIMVVCLPRTNRNNIKLHNIIHYITIIKLSVLIFRNKYNIISYNNKHYFWARLQVRFLFFGRILKVIITYYYSIILNTHLYINTRLYTDIRTKKSYCCDNILENDWFLRVE